MKTKAIIFDMDGLLLDTEPLYTQVTQAVVSRWGKQFTWEIKAQMMGRSAQESGKILIQALQLPITVEELHALQKPLFEQVFPQAQPLAHARELVLRLHQAGVPLGLATSSSKPYFQLKTQTHGDWFSCFQALVTGDEVAHAKPHPEIYLTAAARLGVAPRACLVFEDAPTGVQAAKAAGMQVIAVPDQAMHREAFAQADAILQHLGEFTPQNWGLAL